MGESRRRIGEPLRPAGTGRSALRTARDMEHPGEPVSVDEVPSVEGREAAPSRARFRTGASRSARIVELPIRYGLLHAHTLFSDGSGVPEDAYQRARDRGLDFLAITEHNHARAELGATGARRDGVLIATTPQLYDGTAPVTVTRNFTENGVAQSETITEDSVHSASDAATTATPPPGFVAIPGQEFSSISSGNHVNVLGTPDVLTVANGDFASLYTP